MRTLTTTGALLKPEFTKREKQIIVLLVEKGLGTKELADPLGIAVKTAATHRANIMAKIAYACGLYHVGPLDLALFAVTNGLVDVATIRQRYSLPAALAA